MLKHEAQLKNLAVSILQVLEDKLTLQMEAQELAEIVDQQQGYIRDLEAELERRTVRDSQPVEDYEPRHARRSDTDGLLVPTTGPGPDDVTVDGPEPTVQVSGALLDALGIPGGAADDQLRRPQVAGAGRPLTRPVRRAP